VALQKQAMVDAVAALLRNEPVTLIIEAIAVTAGLAMVIGHNVWSGAALPVIGTLMGWIALIYGVVLLFSAVTGKDPVFRDVPLCQPVLPGSRSFLLRVFECLKSSGAKGQQGDLGIAHPHRAEGSRTGLTSVEPLERAGPKLELAFCFFVGSASQSDRVIDRVRAKRREGFLFGDPQGCWRADCAREGGKPNVLGCRVCVDEIVHAGSACECCCRPCGRILDMHPAPHASSGPDYRDPLLADLLTHIALLAKPGARTVEKAVAKPDKFDAGCGRCRRFEFGVAACAGGHRWGRIEGKRGALIGKVVARRVPEGRALQQVSTHARSPQRR
jgi:hypothetical protein